MLYPIYTKHPGRANPQRLKAHYRFQALGWGQGRGGRLVSMQFPLGDENVLEIEGAVAQPCGVPIAEFQTSKLLKWEISCYVYFITVKLL